MDLRTARLSNRFILVSWALGFALRVAEAGGVPPDALLGAGIPFALLFVLFRFRMIGAGDIKLLCVLGTLLGRAQILRCIAWSFAYGAVFSVGLMLARGNLSARMRYFGRYVFEVLGGGIRPYREGTFSSDANIHFTVPILMAVLLLTGGVT